MRYLLINKYLRPRGGAETYVLTLGRTLEEMGHAVEYFGMAHEENTAGNRVGAGVAPMDFHRDPLRKRLQYPLKVIYSPEARRQLRRVLEDFRPEVCHLNNFNYQLTPGILLEIRRWERQSGHRCRILYTAHDYQLVCPNHMCRDISTGEPCEKCLRGSFLPCIRGRCIHGSRLRSLLGAAEGWFWRRMGIYRELDGILCCSGFLKTRLDRDPVLRDKTLVMHNFVEEASPGTGENRDYVLYFGRYTREKGLLTLLEAARDLPGIPFVFAGAGPLAQRLQGYPNVKDLGFLTGEALAGVIRNARFTVCPSEWYENCPMSVLESIRLGVPVLGADIGGIPELIRPGVTGELFESGSAWDLRRALESLWEDPEKLRQLARGCREARLDSPRDYAGKLLQLLQE